MISHSQKYEVSKRAKKRWFMNAFRWLVSVTLIAAISINSQPASAFSDRWPAIHSRITRNAFPFLRWDIRETIVSGNLDIDDGIEEDRAELHSTSCRFRDGVAFYNNTYVQVVEALREPQASEPNRAAFLFGNLLHGIQDFYAHSNWIPEDPQGLGIRDRLLDSGVGRWPLWHPYANLFDDVVIVEGNPPPGVTIRLPEANGRVSSAVPIVVDKRNLGGGAPIRVFRGLMTAGAPRVEIKVGEKSYWIDQKCPPVFSDCNSDSPDDVCLRHGDGRSFTTLGEWWVPNFEGMGRMNLDGDGGGDWAEARHYARLQTQHEWCRLLHLSRDMDSTFVASGRLLGTWVDDDDSPHIPGTPCARDASGRHLVEISATPLTGTLMVVPFVVFRSDFTNSARTNTISQWRATLRICGDTGDTIVASVMPARINGATLVIQVPETARSWIQRDNRGEFSVRFEIKVTPNGC